MLIPDQKIQVKWTKSNKEWYESLGYEFTKKSDIFYVLPEHLPKSSNVKIKMKCDYCNEVFDVAICSYFRNDKFKQLEEYKCSNCYHKHIADYSLEKRRENWYNIVKAKCEKNNYILLTDKNEIQTVNTKIKYVCPKHGEQKRRVHLFAYGDHGCPKCKIDNQRLSIDEIQQTINQMGCKILNPYDYIDNTTKNLKISCPTCGNMFITSYNSFFATRSKHPQRCPDCSKFESMGEYQIRMFLEKYNIKYIFQHTFDDCKDKKVLPFDFYLPDYNKIIEYDGEQHFFSIPFGGHEDFEHDVEYIQRHDEIKNEYCKRNGILIIRIPYYNYKNIHDILYNELIKSHEDIV